MNSYIFLTVNLFINFICGIYYKNLNPIYSLSKNDTVLFTQYLSNIKIENIII